MLRGEVVLVVGWSAAVRSAAAARAEAPDALAEALAEVDRLIEAGAAAGDAARRVSAATGIPRRRLYRPHDGRASG